MKYSIQNMLPCGNNQFNGRFEFFEWSAPYYNTPKEVMLALMDLPIIGKKVKDIKVIGAVTAPTSSRGFLLGETLMNAGIELEDYWWKKYPNIDKVLVPWEVEACEPFQLIFEDNTTLEVLPTESGGARLAMNSIPIALFDGLNRSNFQANKYFAEIIGKTLESFAMRVKNTTQYYISTYTVKNDKQYPEERSVYQLCFEFDHPFEINLEMDYPSLYYVKMIGDSGLFSKLKTTYCRVKETISEQEYFYICNGRGRGGYFWIVPFNSSREVDEKIPFCDGIGMSIDEDFLFDYFQEFLYRYYEPTIQDYTDYYGPETREFDWYDINLYSFESMKKMIVDIRRAAELLISDYDNPELDIIKKHYPWDSDSNKKLDEYSEEEINLLRKKNVPRIIDLYERFCTRLEKMMALPGRDMISFAGP